MKRSKLFLGITTGLLAVAGIAAAKAHRLDNKLPGYYTSSAGKCTAVAGSFYTVNSQGENSKIATKAVGSIHHILSTVSSSTVAPCSGGVLYTKAAN